MNGELTTLNEQLDQLQSLDSIEEIYQLLISKSKALVINQLGEDANRITISLIECAFNKKEIALCEYVLELAKDLRIDPSGPPFIQAMEKCMSANDLILVRLLLSYGVPTKFRQKVNILSRASKSGDVEAVEFCLSIFSQEIDIINLFDPLTITTLRNVIKNRYFNIIDCFLKYGLDINDFRMPLLKLACQESANVDMFRYLLDHGAMIRWSDELDSALHVLATQRSSCSSAVIRLLVDCGADPYANSRFNSSIPIRWTFHIPLFTELGYYMYGAKPQNPADIIFMDELDHREGYAAQSLFYHNLIQDLYQTIEFNKNVRHEYQPLAVSNVLKTVRAVLNSIMVNQQAKPNGTMTMMDACSALLEGGYLHEVGMDNHIALECAYHVGFTLTTCTSNLKNQLFQTIITKYVTNINLPFFSLLFYSEDNNVYWFQKLTLLFYICYVCLCRYNQPLEPYLSFLIDSNNATLIDFERNKSLLMFICSFPLANSNVVESFPMILSLLLQHDPNIVHYQDNKERTVLHYLLANAPVNDQNDSQVYYRQLNEMIRIRTAVHSMLRLLINEGLDITTTDTQAQELVNDLILRYPIEDWILPAGDGNFEKKLREFKNKHQDIVIT